MPGTSCFMCTLKVLQALCIPLVRCGSVHAGKYIRGVGAEVQFASLQTMHSGQHGLTLFSLPRRKTTTKSLWHMPTLKCYQTACKHCTLMTSIWTSWKSSVCLALLAQACTSHAAQDCEKVNADGVGQNCEMLMVLCIDLSAATEFLVQHFDGHTQQFSFIWVRCHSNLQGLPEDGLTLTDLLKQSQTLVYFPFFSANSKSSCGYMGSAVPFSTKAIPFALDPVAFSALPQRYFSPDLKPWTMQIAKTP